MKTIRLTHRYSNLHKHFAVKTDMSMEALNEIIAYMQLIRDELPTCQIIDDVIGENEVAPILSEHFGCEKIVSATNIDCDDEIDIHANWDIACSLARQKEALYERMAIKRNVVAKAILGKMVEQAEQNAARLATTERVSMRDHLKRLYLGESALPEWNMQTIDGTPIVGVVV